MKKPKKPERPKKQKPPRRNPWSPKIKGGESQTQFFA